MGPLKTIAQAAEWLGIPEESLAKKVSAREVPFTKVGRHVRFADHHLAAIVAAGEEPVAKRPSVLQLAASRAPKTHPPSGPNTPPPPGGPPTKENAA